MFSGKNRNIAQDEYCFDDKLIKGDFPQKKLDAKHDTFHFLKKKYDAIPYTLHFLQKMLMH